MIGASNSAAMQARSRRARAGQLDFLSLPAGPDGIVREGVSFRIDTPWALARYRDVPLRGGWWKFECEGEGEADLSGVEVRISSARDPLIIFRGADAASSRVFLPEFDGYDIALMILPWPGRVAFKRLLLRRLTATEEASVLFTGAQRLIRNRNMLTVVNRLAQRAMAGQSLGVAAAPRQAEQAAPPDAAEPAAPATPSELRIEHGNGVEIVLGPDDRLHPRALELVVDVFARRPEVQAVYADVREGGRITPHPEWDPDLAGWCDFVGTPVFFRMGTEAGIGAGATPWERLKALAQRGSSTIARIPLPLAERPRPVAAAMRLPPPPRLTRTPRVSAVIPTKIRIDLLEKCLDGLAARTGYPDLEVVVVDNGAEDPRFRDVLDAASTRLTLIEMADRGNFNFPRLVNGGVARSSGEIVILLNDDIEALEEGWLHRLVETALAPGVGVVGARLLYPDRTVQHAGVVMGIGGVSGHLWKGAAPEAATRNPYIAGPSGRLAVTGACFAVRRALYDSVGGLDEAAFPVAFNDIDFCLRLDAAGHRTIYRGDVVLIHHESQSRGLDDASAAKRVRLAAETQAFLDRWKHRLGDDPFGSPAFDPTTESGAVHRAIAGGDRNR